MRFVNQHDPLIINTLIYKALFLGGVALGGVGPLDFYDHPTLAAHQWRNHLSRPHFYGNFLVVKYDSGILVPYSKTRGAREPKSKPLVE